MVCHKCAKKLSKSLVTPEFTNSKVSHNLTSGSREIVKNKILVKSQRNLSVKCELCSGRVEASNKYCLTCAYTKGICEICGVKMSETASFKFTDVDIKDSKRQKKMMQKTQNLSNEILMKKGFINDLNSQSNNSSKILKRKRLRTKQSNHMSPQNEKNNSQEKKLLIIEEDNLEDYEEVINI
jgi:hypothetical protein